MSVNTIQRSCLSCKKSYRYLQFFGIKVLDQFFFGRKASEGFMGFPPVVKVYEPSQFILPVSRRGKECFLMPKRHIKEEEV